MAISTSCFVLNVDLGEISAYLDFDASAETLPYFDFDLSSEILAYFDSDILAEEFSYFGFDDLATSRLDKLALDGFSEGRIEGMRLLDSALLLYLSSRWSLVKRLDGREDEVEGLLFLFKQ